MRYLAAILTLIAIVSPTLADDWYIGFSDPDEVVTLITDRFVDGNIIILNNGRLNVNANATLSLTGELQVFDTASLDMLDATLLFLQGYAYQGGILVSDQGQVSCNTSTIQGSGHSVNIVTLGQSHVEWRNVNSANGYLTWVLFEGSSADIAGSTSVGEFVIHGDGTLTISDSSQVLFWLTMPDGSIVDTTMPPPGDVSSFTVGPDTPWASGIPYNATITNCTDVSWGVTPKSGSNGTFRESTLQVVGSLFDWNSTIEITGIANNAVISDTSYAWGGVSLHFINTTVRTWNFYAAGTTKLTIQSCLFGELMTWDQAEVWVIGSMCDGSGGFLSATDQSVLYLINSMNISPTTVQDDAYFFVMHSALLSPVINAIERGKLLLLNAEYYGEPRAHDEAAVFDAAIEPTEGFIDDTVSLRGSARIITGPDSPFTFEGYELQYSQGDDPDQWTALTGLINQEVRDNTLAPWDTMDMEEGLFTVRLSVHNNLGGPLEVTAPVWLWFGACPADFNRDGKVNTQDFIEFLNAFTGGDPAADFNNDGEVNTVDVIEFLNAWIAGCS